MLEFIYPFFIYGLLALIPLWILHFLFKNRLQVIKFSAMEFLFASKRKRQKSLLLRNFLLILFRSLLLAAVIFAFSRPFWSEQKFQELNSDTFLIVIDNSASSEPSFLEMKIKLKSIIRSKISGGSKILLADINAKALIAKSTRNLASLNRVVKFLNIHRGKISSHFWQNISDLTNKNKIAKVIFVSDFLKGTLSLIGKVPKSLSQKVTWIKTLENFKQKNFQIEKAFLELKSSKSFNLKVFIKNTQQKGKQLSQKGLIRVFNGNKKLLEQQFSCLPEQKKQLSFSLPIGGLKPKEKLKINLSEDYFSWDNNFELQFDKPNPIRLLVINGAYKSSTLQDEVFYLKNALQKGLEGKTKIDYSISTPEQLETTDIKDFDVIWLANVSNLATQKLQKILRAVFEGSSLIFSMGDQVDPEIWNKNLESYLPARLRGKKSYLPGDELELSYFKEELSLWKLSNVKLLQGNLISSKTSSFMLVEPLSDPSIEKLMDFENKNPFLLKRKVGKGKVYLWTTSIDRDWTNLPINSSFVPFVQQLIRNASPRRIQYKNKSVLAGEPYAFLSSEEFETIEAKAGDGTMLPAQKSKKSFQLPLDQDKVVLSYLDKEGRIFLTENLVLRPSLSEAELGEFEVSKREGSSSDNSSSGDENFDLTHSFFLFAFLSLFGEAMVRYFL